MEEELIQERLRDEALEGYQGLEEKVSGIFGPTNRPIRPKVRDVVESRVERSLGVRAGEIFVPFIGTVPREPILDPDLVSMMKEAKGGGSRDMGRIIRPIRDPCRSDVEAVEVSGKSEVPFPRLPVSVELKDRTGKDTVPREEEDGECRL